MKWVSNTPETRLLIGMDSEGRKDKAGEVSRFTPMMSYHFISELQTSVYMAHLFFVALNFHWCKLVQVVLCKCTAERERNSYYMHSKLWMKVSIYMIHADTVGKNECRLECCIFLSKPDESKTAVTKPDLKSTGVLFFTLCPIEAPDSVQWSSEYVLPCHTVSH